MMKRRITSLSLTLIPPFAILIIFMILFFTKPVHANTCDVPATYSTIQAAVADSACDLINITPGSYVENVIITRRVTIQGQGSNTIVDGNATGSVFTIQSGLAVTLTAMTIQNGSALQGGGIRNDTGKLILNDVIIQDNIGGDGSTFLSGGGGIYNNRGDVEIRNSQIISNAGQDGASGGNEGSKGGGIMTYFGKVTLINSHVDYNWAGDGSSPNGRGGFGGGIYNQSGNVRLLTSTLSFNRSGNGVTDSGTASGGPGGGIYTSGGQFTAQHSQINNNQTGRGISANAGLGAGISNGGNGTILLENSTINDNRTGSSHALVGAGGAGISSTNGGNITLLNSTVSGNQISGAHYGGGGILVWSNGSNSSYLNLINSTITSNTGSSGAGIHNVQYGNGIAVVNLQNSIIADNNGLNCENTGGQYNSQGYNIDSDDSCGLSASTDLSNTIPLLQPLANYGGTTSTHALQSGSPARDRIPTSDCAAGTDQRGILRPQGEFCDIGSVEMIVYPLTISQDGSGNGTVTSIPAGIECGLTCTASFEPGTEVTLTATPDTFSTFTGWDGLCQGSGTCTVMMTDTADVTATFNLIPHDLTVTLEGTGQGTISSIPAGIKCGLTCTVSFDHGTVVTLTATAAPDSSFAGWGGECAGMVTPDCQITITNTILVNAQFTALPPEYWLYLPLVLASP